MVAFKTMGISRAKGAEMPRELHIFAGILPSTPAVPMGSTTSGLKGKLSLNDSSGRPEPRFTFKGTSSELYFHLWGFAMHFK